MPTATSSKRETGWGDHKFKSIGAVLVFTLLFGPLGLAYVNGYAALVGFSSLLLIGAAGPEVIPILWIASIIFGVVAARQHNKRLGRISKVVSGNAPTIDSEAPAAQGIDTTTEDTSASQTEE